MATAIVPNQDKPVQLVGLLDPVTGLALGTAASPLMTGTSSLQTTADLTNLLITISTATTTSLVAAVASQRTRLYRFEIDCAAANSVTINAVVNRVYTFGAGGNIVRDFATRAWATTAVNTALTATTTTTAVTNINIEYTRNAL